MEQSLLIYAGDRTSVLMATELREPSVTAAFLLAASDAFGECRRCACLSSPVAWGVLVFLCNCRTLLLRRHCGASRKSNAAAHAFPVQDNAEPRAVRERVPPGDRRGRNVCAGGLEWLSRDHLCAEEAKAQSEAGGRR